MKTSIVTVSTFGSLSKKPNIVVVGAGLIGRRHAELVSRHAVLGAIVDPDPNSKDFANSLDTRWYSDLANYLTSAKPDGVIIATPNRLHAEHALICIENDLPCLIEKPITDKAQSAFEVIKAAEAKKVPLLVGHHRRHNPLIARAKEVIDAGDIGDIRVVNAQFWLYKPEGYFSENWRQRSGAGPIFINLIHDVDLLRHLCGEITEVEARQSTAARGFEVEDTAAILLRFAGGAVGTVSLSDSVVAPWSWEFASGENPAYPKTSVPSYMIGGSHGSLSIPDLHLWTQPNERHWWNPLDCEQLQYETADPLVRQLDHFADVITGHCEPLVSGREGTMTLAVIEAIKRAADSGNAQKIHDYGT